jgi:cystathionine beta-synthase
VVLLPDSSSKYLSKIFNDSWMRENGYLDPETRFGTVADLIEGRGARELVTIEPTARVTEAVGVLKLHGISQMPVIDNGKLCGVLFEKRVLEKALKGGPSSALVGDIVDASYCAVDMTTEISVLAELFRRFKVAIVLDDDKTTTEIITRIDLIDYISRSANGTA